MQKNEQVAASKFLRIPLRAIKYDVTTRSRCRKTSANLSFAVVTFCQSNAWIEVGLVIVLNP